MESVSGTAEDYLDAPALQSPPALASGASVEVRVKAMSPKPIEPSAAVTPSEQQAICNLHDLLKSMKRGSQADNTFSNEPPPKIERARRPLLKHHGPASAYASRPTSAAITNAAAKKMETCYGNEDPSYSNRPQHSHQTLKKIHNLLPSGDKPTKRFILSSKHSTVTRPKSQNIRATLRHRARPKSSHAHSASHQNISQGLWRERTQHLPPRARKVDPAV